MTTDAQQLQLHREEYRARLHAAVRMGCCKEDVKAYVHNAICLAEAAEDERPTWEVALEALEIYVILESYQREIR